MLGLLLLLPCWLCKGICSVVALVNCSARMYIGREERLADSRIT